MKPLTEKEKEKLAQEWKQAFQRLAANTDKKA